MQQTLLSAPLVFVWVKPTLTALPGTWKIELLLFAAQTPGQLKSKFSLRFNQRRLLELLLTLLRLKLLIPLSQYFLFSLFGRGELPPEFYSWQGNKAL